MQSKMNKSAEAASVFIDVIKSIERTIRDNKATETKFINDLNLQYLYETHRYHNVLSAHKK